jgi:hypothetical protein
MKFATGSLALVLLLLSGGMLAYATGPQGTIKHVIIVIQENRTPTNLFHEDAPLAANGAHVQPPNNQGLCKTSSPITLTPVTNPECFDPTIPTHRLG